MRTFIDAVLCLFFEWLGLVVMYLIVKAFVT